MRFLLLVLVLGLLAILMPPAPPSRAGGERGPRTVRWYIYRDADSKENHGAWTNWMPLQAGKMMKLSMVHSKDPASGATCIRVDIKWQHPFWCGIVVSCLPDYWGAKPSAATYDLRKARKLVFHARGQKGGESIQVKVAIAGDQKYGDSARAPASTEWLTLTKGWRSYELDLTGMDLSRVVTPFCFVANRDHNAGDITFFLDDIFVVMDAGK